jgi:hypothetical protein
MATNFLTFVLLLPGIIQYGAAAVVPGPEATTYCTGGPVNPPTAATSTFDISKCKNVPLNGNCVVGCASNYVIKPGTSAPKAWKCTKGKQTLIDGTWPTCVGMLHPTCHTYSVY